jgi:hypothetical protein
VTVGQLEHLVHRVEATDPDERAERLGVVERVAQADAEDDRRVDVHPAVGVADEPAPRRPARDPPEGRRATHLVVRLDEAQVLLEGRQVTLVDQRAVQHLLARVGR